MQTFSVETDLYGVPVYVDQIIGFLIEKSVKTSTVTLRQDTGGKGNVMKETY